MIPTPEQIKAARLDSGLTQTEAARLVGAALKTWQNWEASPDLPSHRQMREAIWELFNLKRRGYERTNRPA